LKGAKGGRVVLEERGRGLGLGVELAWVGGQQAFDSGPLPSGGKGAAEKGSSLFRPSELDLLEASQALSPVPLLLGEGV
jgi:hypothetical protein